MVISGLSWRNLLKYIIDIVVNKIYSIVVGKNQLYAKTLTVEPPPAKYACSDSCYSVHCSMVLFCQHIPCADPFRAAMYYVADFSDED